MKKSKDALFDRLLDIAARGTQETLSRSWCLARRDERKRRLSTVIALSAELSRIRETGALFATGLAEQAIELVIEGDWKGAAEYVRVLSFTENSDLFGADPERNAHLTTLWKPFVDALRRACAEA